MPDVMDFADLFRSLIQHYTQSPQVSSHQIQRIIFLRQRDPPQSKQSRDPPNIDRKQVTQQ